jgi:formylglycine-generating enzyme required for sulfatase activity
MKTLLGVLLAILLPLVSLSSGQEAAEETAAVPRTGKPWTVPAVGIPLVPIPSGTFKMGSPEPKEWEADQKPVHTVIISRPFWMAAHETTIGEYLVFLRESGTKESGLGLDDDECPVKLTEDGYVLAGGRFGSSERQPITYVSWYGAQRFCDWLTDRVLSTANLPEGYIFRLPTEAEWEYACRAGSKGEYSGDPDKTAWYFQNSENKTHEVAKKAPNDWGLYDMIGNVSEWCLDWYLPYPSGRVVDPLPTKTYRNAKVLRGCGFTNFRYACRIATRLMTSPDKPGGGWGFRIVLGPKIAPHDSKAQEP